MKKIINFLILIVGVTVIISCGQDSTKQKELELKERELAFKEKELSIKQNDLTTSETKSKIVEQENDNSKQFLGCWYWGNKQDGDFAILEVKPNNLLIIHRLDISPGEEVMQNAGYKISGSKIVFNRNSILMDSKFHIDNNNRQVFLVEEYQGSPNKFLKVNCK